MKIPRRNVLRLATGAVAFPAVLRLARAQAYPTRAVHIIVGLPAGLNPDLVARLIGEWLSQRFDQPFVVEDRPGAGTNIATEAVLRAAPDGHSLLLATISNAINATLYPRLKFNFMRDTTPVAALVRVPYVMAINPSLPTTTVPEFIAYAKANPGKINMASGGNGSANQLFGEMFKVMAGVEMVHVPYHVNYLPDLLGGQVQVVFTPISASLGFIKSGKLRALAVTTAARTDVLPNVPTLGEYLPGYVANAWNGITAPKNTPTEIVARLNKEINAGLADPTLKARLVEMGNEAIPMTVAEFGKFIADETEKWANVIKSAGIKPD